MKEQKGLFLRWKNYYEVIVKDKYHWLFKVNS